MKCIYEKKTKETLKGAMQFFLEWCGPKHHGVDVEVNDKNNINHS